MLGFDTREALQDLIINSSLIFVVGEGQQQPQGMSPMLTMKMKT